MKKKQSDSVETPVSSLIDVVFLLIIFFVVTASFDAEIVDSSIELARAEHVAAVEKKDPMSVTINVRSDGTYTMMNQPKSLNQISNILNSVRQRNNDVPIIIRADGSVRYGVVADLQDAITAVGFYKVRLAALVK